MGKLEPIPLIVPGCFSPDNKPTEESLAREFVAIHGERWRFATIIRMADALRGPALLPVIEGIIGKIREERSETLCEIDDTIAAVKAFESAGWEQLQRFDAFFEDCAGELVASAEHSCGSNELRALLEQYEDPQKSSHPLKTSLKTAFGGFLGNYLSDEIRNCQSEQDFDSLIDHLEYFGRTFAVDVDNQIASVTEARDEYVDYEEQRADQQMDEYKEHRREERANSADIMLRDHAVGKQATGRAQLIERFIVMALAVGHVGEPVEDEPIGREVGGHLIEMMGDAVPRLDQLDHVALPVGGEDAVLDEMGEGALELLALFHDFRRRGGIIIRDSGAPALLRRDPVDDIALQLFGMVDDQDHLKGAVADQAAFQLRQSTAQRIGVAPLASRINFVRWVGVLAHGLGTRTA